jgi:hypothetical protein
VPFNWSSAGMPARLRAFSGRCKPIRQRAPMRTRRRRCETRSQGYPYDGYPYDGYPYDGYPYDGSPYDGRRYEIFAVKRVEQR